MPVKKTRYSIKHCEIAGFETSEQCDSSRPIQVLVFGDSHDIDGFNAFNQIVGNNENVNLILFNRINKCEIVVNSDKLTSSFKGRQCIPRTETLNLLIEQKFFTHVVYSANAPFNLENKGIFWQAMGHMKRKHPGLGIIVLGEFLILKEDCSVIANRHRTFSKCFAEGYIKWFDTHDTRMIKVTSNSEHRLIIYISIKAICCAGMEDLKHV